jgi:hypothetical protein
MGTLNETLTFLVEDEEKMLMENFAEGGYFEHLDLYEYRNPGSRNWFQEAYGDAMAYFYEEIKRELQWELIGIDFEKSLS